MNLPEYQQGRCIDGTLDGHDWTPLSFAFETQLLDNQGRVRIRQPDVNEGHVYCVCMRCHQHTYVVTKWAGFFLPDPWVEEAEQAESCDHQWQTKGIGQTHCGKCGQVVGV